MKRLFALATLLAAVSACSSPATPTPTVPAAVVQATGEGALVVHPSADGRFQFALEMPLRVRETAGGSASWTFARMSLLRNGVEIERSEVGRDVIVSAGFGSVAANSSSLARVVFRFNSLDFTSITITLGMSDVKDGRAFTADVPSNSFSDVTTSFTPLNGQNRVE